MALNCVKLQEPGVSYRTAVVGPPRCKGGGATVGPHQHLPSPEHTVVVDGEVEERELLCRHHVRVTNVAAPPDAP